MAIGPWEIVVILVILVLIFGAGRLAQVGGAMGSSVREFRGAVKAEPVAAPPPAPVVPPVICAACNVSNTGTNKFCSGCGATLVAAPPVPAITAAPAPPEQVEITCPSCATLNPPGQPFCGQCGTRLTTAAA